MIRFTSRHALPALLAALVAALPSRAARPQATADTAGVRVTFLANEGVMLEAGGRKVLVDALFRKYERGFAVPDDSTQRALASARAPFDSVDLILVTHRHGDHFHPAPVAAHLRANPRAVLLASAQVVDSLRGRVAAGDPLSRRVLARTLAPGARRREVVGGVSVEMLGLRHHDLQHLGFIVEIGGRRVLHVGDTDDAEDAFPPLRLDTARIDVALVPYWMVNSERGRRTIERWVRPRQVVAFHVGTRESARAERGVRKAMPAAVTFVRSLDARRW